MTNTRRLHAATTAGTNPSALTGFSLVELLVALALALLLLLGIVQVFSGSRATARLTEAQTRVQETGRYATQVLTQELRMARGAGCSSLGLDDYRNTLNVVATSLREGITENRQGLPVGAVGAVRALGYTAAQADAKTLVDLPTTAKDVVTSLRIKTRGDVLVYWGIVGEGVYADVTASESPTGLIKLVGSSDILKAGRLALITDCEGSDIFAVTGDPADTGTGSVTQFGHDKTANKSAALSRAYNWTGTATMPGPAVRARVFPFDLKVFFIGCVDQTSGEVVTNPGEGGSPCSSDASTRYRPALCRWSASTGTDVLLLDIADLRVTYDGFLDAGKEAGAKAAGKTRFRDMEAVTNAAWVAGKAYWGRVDTLRIELLATSADEVSAVRLKPYTTSANSNALGYGLPADRRVYEAYRFTIATRANSTWFSTSH